MKYKIKNIGRLITFQPVPRGIPASFTFMSYAGKSTLREPDMIYLHYKDCGFHDSVISPGIIWVQP